MWTRKVSALAGALACVLSFGVSGCGSERAGDSTSTEQSDSSRETPKAEEPGSDGGLDSPVTFERFGGLAGFHDTLVVRPDGKVTLEGRRGDPFGCTVPRPMLTKIADAAGSVQLEASDVPAKKLNREPMPDELFTSVTVDGTEYKSAVASEDESLRQLFRLMHDLLDAAYAARDGGNSSCG